MAPRSRLQPVLPLVLLTAVGLLSCSSTPSPGPGDATTNAGPQNVAPARSDAMDSTDYAEVLRRFVNDSGGVDYAGLQADRDALDRYVAALGTVPPSRFDAWPEPEQIAFLINAYNAFTLVSIVDRYPVKSIRDIPGVWRLRRFDMAGRRLTLDAIEHQILRRDYNEPRIHMAVNCASIGCPVLRQEPFTGKRLDEQLEDQVQRMVRDPNQFRIDRPGGSVHISSVFDWFGKDFIPSFAPERPPGNLSDKQAASVTFLARYLPEDDRRHLESGDYTLRYLDWDWGLNTAAALPAGSP